METNKYVLRRDRSADREARYRIAYAEELNPAQHQAVVSTDGPLLVVAGAGTGKTRTLVYRVARLVESGVDPTQILLLTFTRKASAEMLRRASNLLDGRCDQVSGGTFHSFANLTLRRYGKVLGLHSSFTILDRGDSEDVINLLRAHMGLDKKERRFPRKQAIAEIFSMAVNKSRPLAELIEVEYSHLIDHLAELIELQQRFTAFKAERQLLDYDDLLIKLWQLLDLHSETRSQLSLRYRYIMVDEYQDTNALQAEIVRLLGSEHRNVMAVGDDAQSIYSFRGADFRNIMDFPALFPGAQVIALEENYRSTQPILDVTNSIIGAARERHEKQLFSRRSEGRPPILVPAENEHFQSRFVCQRILELREEGVPLEQIAVLFRSSFHSFALEIELAHHDLPFIKRGGFKFIEAAHIKDLLAHVRILLNPQDSISWHRVLTLLEGIGPRASEEILQHVQGAADPAAQLEQLPARKYSHDLRLLAGLLRQSQQWLQSPEQLVAELLQYYEPILKRAYPEDHPKRRKDLDHFATIAARYQRADQLLADMALEPPTDSVSDVLAGDRDDELLTLSTIHSAKGLEWHTVFIIWTAEGRFPSAYINSEEEMEEERRLMYVAATRAKQELYFSYPVYIFDRSLGTILGKASRFLEDIPEQLLRRLVLVEEPADYS
ncbi:MAG TPA: ATP-dependent helicase [Terriglobales bacterium]|nr:ATP-dependent helicase [Terriglobales bacterium]